LTVLQKLEYLLLVLLRDSWMAEKVAGCVPVPSLNVMDVHLEGGLSHVIVPWDAFKAAQTSES
jgi:hypothetical protein